MSWKVWKQPLERAQEEYQKGYSKGINLSDWNLAQSSFSTAFDLYNKAGDIANAELCRGLALLSKALANPLFARNWSDAALAVNNTGLSQIDFTQTVSTKDLSQECELKASEMNATSIKDNLQKATQIEEVAKKYMTHGSKGLLLSLLIEKHQTTGQSKAHRLIAEAMRLRGMEEVDLDPKHAAEFYRMASIHLKTAGDIEGSKYLSGKAEDFSSTAICYFCGREVTGKEINFVYMKAKLTRFIEKQNSSKALPSTLPNMVVACAGCNSAITIAADEIALRYFNKVEAELHQFMNSVNNELAQLRRQINSLSLR